MSGKSFNTVWADLLKVARSVKHIYTIDQDIKNEVVEVTDSYIVLNSQRREEKRKFTKAYFKRMWDQLAKRGQCWPEHGDAAVKAFLAYLPYVEYEKRPNVEKRCLYLMGTNTHRLGTRKRR